MVAILIKDQPQCRNSSYTEVLLYLQCKLYFQLYFISLQFPYFQDFLWLGKQEIVINICGSSSID